MFCDQRVAFSAVGSTIKFWWTTEDNGNCLYCFEWPLGVPLTNNLWEGYYYKMLGFYIVFSRFLRHCYPDTTLSFVLPSSPCLHLNALLFPIFLYKHKFHDGRSIVLLARMAHSA